MRSRATRSRDLTVPASSIAAADDPVIPIADLADLAASPALESRCFARGGHCAFLESYRLRSWVDRAVLAEIEAARDASSGLPLLLERRPAARRS